MLLFPEERGNRKGRHGVKYARKNKSENNVKVPLLSDGVHNDRGDNDCVCVLHAEDGRSGVGVTFTGMCVCVC